MNNNLLLAILGGIVAVLIIAVVAVSIVLVSRGSSSRGGGGGSSSQKAGSSEAFRLPGDDPLSLDPAQVFDTNSSEYVVHLFGGLVTIDKDLKIVPDIAKAAPDI